MVNCNLGQVKWEKFFQRNRHDFKDLSSQYMSLCSAYFEESCNGKNLPILISMVGLGIKMKYSLRNDAVPIRCCMTRSKGAH